MSTKALIVPAVTKHTATIIMAHGLGDSGAGWSFLAQNWRARQKFDEVKFVFPNAPMIPITINGGMRMPGWYDIASFGDNGAQDEAGLLKSRDYFEGLIKEEINSGIPSERIIVGGFSQGGVISLLTGLTTSTKLAGFFGLSCYVPLHNKIKDLIPADSPNKNSSIFMGHGDMDPVLRVDWGKRSADLLKEYGWKVDFRVYPGLPHSADPQEIDDLEGWIKSRLSEQKSGL